jgi:hypothetical protein
LQRCLKFDVNCEVDREYGCCYDKVGASSPGLWTFGDAHGIIAFRSELSVGFAGSGADCVRIDAWSLVMVLLARLVFSSATRQTSSPPNMSPRSSITTLLLSCESPRSSLPRRSSDSVLPASKHVRGYGKCKALFRQLISNHILLAGSATNHTHSDSSIPPDKKITIVCALSPTPRPMSSWFASP